MRQYRQVTMNKPTPLSDCPLFWFINWTINNRGADEAKWMVNRYYANTTEAQFVRLRIHV